MRPRELLAGTKRERWTQQIKDARATAPKSKAITPAQSIAAVMQERRERYRERLAGVSERVIGHVEAMHPDENSPVVRNLSRSIRLRVNIWIERGAV